MKGKNDEAMGKYNNDSCSRKGAKYAKKNKGFERKLALQLQ